MEPHQPTTPFGRRSLTLAHVATQMAAANRPSDKVVHKWQVFRSICTAKPKLGVSERALAVLNALLSFYPEATLTGEDDLIVFPSNEQLCLRAHGMCAPTLRRALAALVDAGLIVRRDSPNGKRYARKGRGGEIEVAFGFDLAPLVVRAEEFQRLADEIEAEARAIRLARERITLLVLSACPNIVDYAKGGIAHWRDLLATSASVVPMMGISPNAWGEAQSIMGETQATIVIACLLQRSSAIHSAGGYLRELTRKAEAGEFSLGPILMAQINARTRERRSA